MSSSGLVIRQSIMQCPFYEHSKLDLAEKTVVAHLSAKSIKKNSDKTRAKSYVEKSIFFIAGTFYPFLPITNKWVHNFRTKILEFMGVIHK